MKKKEDNRKKEENSSNSLIAEDSDLSAPIWDEEDTGAGEDGFTVRKKGAGRFFELLGRDFGHFYIAALMFLLGVFPGFLVVYFSIMAEFFPGVILGGVLGGLLGGPLLCGLFDTMLRSMRDEMGFWWNSYRKAWKQNVKQSLIPGIIFGIFLAIWGNMMLTLPDLENVPTSVWICMLLGIVFLLILLVYVFAQIVLVNLGTGIILKNAGLFLAGYFPRSLAAGVISAIYWALCMLYLPYSVAVLLLTGAWLPSLIALMFVYPVLDRALHIEEKNRRMQEKKYADL